MKVKIKFLTMLLFFSYSSLFYGGTKTSDTVPETMKQYYHFEIYNKSMKDIWFALLDKDLKDRSQDVYGKQAITMIPANKKLRLLNIDPKASYTIFISSAKAQEDLKFKIKANNARKNIFLTWDDSDPKKKEFLRPQSGPLKGLLGKTESGLSLSGNIKQSDIEKPSSF